jgi:pyruvate dehydrogenase E2 component (dihydrolipoamide acetyltransferase)
MNSGSVQQWKKKVGDSVKKGELLFVVATDKLTVDVESPADGVLIAITVPEGQEVPVGAPLGVIGQAGENAGDATSATPINAAPTGPGDAAPSRTTALPKSVPSVGNSSNEGNSSKAASPKAKKLAREKGVDLSTLRGTGPNGWIVARDVAAATAKASPVAAKMAEDLGIDLQSLDSGKRVMKADVQAAITSAAGRRVAVTQMRRVIGERMLQSVSTIPAVNYFVDADMSALNDLRASFNARIENNNRSGSDRKSVKISVNDILMKLCAKLLLENPMANAYVETDASGKAVSFILHDSVNVGFAVALPGGLVVPNIKDVQTKSLTQIARERAELLEKARGGGLAPDDTSGGTFTVSNLGSVTVNGAGVDSFTPIINPPEAAILGVGTTREKPVVHEGSVAVRPVATLCLTVDHRLVDGADAAVLLAKLKELIENPELFLL